MLLMVHVFLQQWEDSVYLSVSVHLPCSTTHKCHCKINVYWDQTDIVTFVRMIAVFIAVPHLGTSFGKREV